MRCSTPCAISSADDRAATITVLGKAGGDLPGRANALGDPPVSAVKQVLELTLTVYADAASFLQAARSFLMTAQAETSIISLPAARMAESPQPEDVHAYHATVAMNGRV